MFKVGDRFFVLESRQHFVLVSYNPNLDVWTGKWNSGGPSRIYPEELEKLKYFNFTLVKVKNDKHLFELILRY